MIPLHHLIEHAIRAGYHIYVARKSMKKNREECERFGRHVQTILELVKRDVARGRGAEHHGRISRICHKIIELQHAIAVIAKKGDLYQFLWHKAVSRSIQKLYAQLDRTVGLLALTKTIDIVHMLREHETARRKDAKDLQDIYNRLLRSNKDILDCLQIRASQVDEARVAIRNHLPEVPNPQERRFFERGLHDLERRSRNRSGLPDKFVITSLDVVIHYDKKLGSGGYSQVYAGNWMGTAVAVKVLEPGLPHSLMDREINVWKDLRHPNIVGFYGACSIHDPPFMVCEYKANGDALKYLRKYPDANRIQLLLEACRGLSHIHSKKVIHGDIKGGNILVDEWGNACLADFGLSQVRIHSQSLSKERDPSRVQGTLRWMSPEQMTYGKLDEKTDIYSFAMTVYEVFTGHSPFPGAPETAIQSNVCKRNARPQRPSGRDVARLGLDDELWSVVERCWDKHAAYRLSADRLCKRLEDLLSSHDAKASSVRPVAHHTSSQGSATESSHASYTRELRPPTPPRQRSDSGSRKSSRYHGSSAGDLGVIVVNKDEEWEVHLPGTDGSTDFIINNKPGSRSSRSSRKSTSPATPHPPNFRSSTPPSVMPPPYTQPMPRSVAPMRSTHTIEPGWNMQHHYTHYPYAQDLVAEGWQPISLLDRRYICSPYF